MSDVKLRPCPFCGSYRVRYSAFDEAVECHECGALGPCVSEEDYDYHAEAQADAEEAWNRRVQ